METKPYLKINGPKHVLVIFTTHLETRLTTQNSSALTQLQAKLFPVEVPWGGGGIRPRPFQASFKLFSSLNFEMKFCMYFFHSLTLRISKESQLSVETIPLCYVISREYQVAHR